MALKVLRYSNIAEYRQIIRRSLCGQESDLAAVSHETSQKLTTTTIDTRGAAVSSGWWRRFFVLLVVLFVVVLTLRFFFFFQRPRDLGEINKTCTSISSKLCSAYDRCVALPRKKTSAREIRCTLQGCCLRRIRLWMPLPFGFQRSERKLKKTTTTSPLRNFFAAEPR